MVVHSAKNAKRWETSQLCNAEIMQKESNIFMQENENPLRYMQDLAMQLLLP